MRIQLVLGALSSLFIAACGNEAHQPVGPTTNPGVPNEPQAHAFIWSELEGTREIPLPSDARRLPQLHINDAGEVTGGLIAADGTSKEAFVWSEARGYQRTGKVSDIYGGVIVTGINSSSMIVGYVGSGDFERSFVWNRDTGFIPPTGEKNFGATAINDSGTIVGFYDDYRSPVTWNKDTGFQPLKAMPTECTVATAINESGEILGWYGTSKVFGCGHSDGYVIWRNRADPIEVIKCPESSSCSLELLAINNSGEAVGHLNGNAVRLRTRTREGQQPQLLADAAAIDINDAGDVAVVYGSRPYIWSAAGELRQVPLLAGTTSGDPRAINNRGQVVGWMR